MTALVVGASGHLGAHLVRVLRRNGDSVRALVRPASDVRGLAGVGAEIVRGDVLDPPTLLAAADGCAEVYHLAAPTALQADTSDVIVVGTRNVLEACRRAAVRRLVYTSSIVTIGYSTTPDVVLDERINQRTDASVYHSAKWEAEREVIAAAATDAVEIVVVNPATIVGSLDYRVTPSNAPIQRCLDHGLRLAVSGGLTIVHAEDAARGLMLAMQRGRRGERYILGGDRLTIPDYFGLIAAACARPGPVATLPRFAVLGGALALGALERLTGRPAPLTFTQARHLAGKFGWYSSDKAVRELGYSWRPAAEAVTEYVTWVQCGRPADRNGHVAAG